MSKPKLRSPSPALVVSSIALFVALGGTTYAATSLPRNSVGTTQLKKNAVTSSKIRDRAVGAAKINTSGLTVPTALHASTADHATNSDQLGGVAASAYQRRVSGTCTTAVTAVDQTGSVTCAARTVVPIDVLLPDAPHQLANIDLGDLRFGVGCDGLPTLIFHNSAATPATLNWFYFEGAANAGGIALASSTQEEFAFQAARIEGQFIYSVHNQEVITVNLHAIDLNTSCEVTGTIEYAPE